MEFFTKLLGSLRRPDLQEKSKTKIFGYQDTIAQVKKRINNRQNFIVSGPSGVGKTTMIRQIAEGSGLHFLYIKATWTTASRIGDAETQLGDLFTEAIANAPSLIFIDNIDYICVSSAGYYYSSAKDKVFNMIDDQLEYMQSLENKVLVVVATNRLEALKPQITKYFDDKIVFALPSYDDRLEMLKELFPDLVTKHRELIAAATKSYLFEDLKKVRSAAKLEGDGELTYESVESALSKIKPRTVCDYTTPCLSLKWEDIGGLEDVKKELQDSIIKPLKNQERFKKFGLDMDRGALLYGPPGCSKTMLAQALATESGFNFIAVKGPELISKWVGESEAGVRRVYRNAREIAPCIIFFDEIDGFATERTNSIYNSQVNERIVAQLLTEFNGPPDNVFTLAATNRPDNLDSALLRPGRLDSTIYIPLPTRRERAEIFRVHMRNLPLKCGELLPDEIAGQLASQTDNYTGAEIRKICRLASRYACLESDNNEFVELRHFCKALQSVEPTTSPKLLKTYEEFRKKTLRYSENAKRRDLDEFVLM